MLLGLLSASSPSESLIVDWIVNSLNPFIEEIGLSLVTRAISRCGGEMVGSRYGEIVKCSDGKMVEWHVTFVIFPCDFEMVQWVLK